MTTSELQANLQKLGENGGIKALGASLITGFTAFFSNDFMIYFMYFTILVILDLFTKQLSLSAKYLAAKKHVEISDIQLRAKLLGIAPAFDAGVINSLYMRDKFSKKLLTYMLVVGSAFFTDCMICGASNKDSFIFFKLAITYLAVNEFLSVLENLRDGGNKRIGRLINAINKKIDKML